MARLRAVSPGRDRGTTGANSSLTMPAIHDTLPDLSNSVSGERPRCVLLAEDDAALRVTLQLSLERDDYMLLVASNGAEVVDYMTEARFWKGPMPEVIVMDVRMPKCTGLELLEALRAAGWRIPVILLTAFGDSVTHRRAAELGAARLLDKPFDVDELRQAIIEAYRTSRAELCEAS
jgi:CheY-like chemotaxis protein